MPDRFIVALLATAVCSAPLLAADRAPPPQPSGGAAVERLAGGGYIGNSSRLNALAPALHPLPADSAVRHVTPIADLHLTVRDCAVRTLCR